LKVRPKLRMLLKSPISSHSPPLLLLNSQIYVYLKV
jgi:hypothetical protein